MKKRGIYSIGIIIFIGLIVLFFGSRVRFYKDETKIYLRKIEIEDIECLNDKDNDGVNDMEDILNGAKNQIGIAKYVDKYYKEGYPPEDEGVCTDVIWRALKEAGYNLKDMMDEDIKNNVSEYTRVNGQPEPNIDFRRIKNLVVFFKKYAESLTVEIIPGDVDNLKQWQRGDIVIFADPAEHIAIISDKRDIDGVPYIIHNSGPKPKENKMLMKWNDNYSPIIYHFRFPKKDHK